MSKHLHTPGPDREGQEHVAYCHPINAPLIAAAPALLAAAESVLAALEGRVHSNPALTSLAALRVAVRAASAEKE